VWSGVTGLIQKPVQGAMSGGAAGAVGGLGKGVVGLFAKPLSGMAGLANKVTEGIGSEAKKLTNLTASEVGMQGLLRLRQPRDLYDGVLRIYPREPPLVLSEADRVTLLQGKLPPSLSLTSEGTGANSSRSEGAATPARRDAAPSTTTPPPPPPKPPPPPPPIR
jgi:hypothetical protein